MPVLQWVPRSSTCDVERPSELQNAVGREAAAQEVGERDQIALEPAPAIDKRLRLEPVQRVDDDVPCRDVVKEPRRNRAFPGQVDGVGDLRIAERQPVVAALLVAEMNAPQLVRLDEQAAALDLAAEI